MKTDTLELLSNKAFKHYFKNNINTGTWKLNSAKNEVEFNNFKFNEYNGTGIWISRIVLTNGEIHFNVNSDLSDGFYIKIDDK